MRPQQHSSYHPMDTNRVGSWGYQAASTTFSLVGPQRAEGWECILQPLGVPPAMPTSEGSLCLALEGGRQPSSTQGPSPKPLALQIALLIKWATSYLSP